jgi:hypothetical protein
MVRMKMIARKHVYPPPHTNDVPTESHSDGQNTGYILRTLRIMLLVLGSSGPLLFIGTLRLLHGNSYLWHLRAVIYERPMTDHIHRIRQVVEAPAARWMLEVGMREAALEALAIL